MATASLTKQVSEERLGELRGLADRFETIEHIKLYQFQDVNQLDEYLDQKNYTNRDIVEAYKAFVKGETGEPEQQQDYGNPDYHRPRERWEYAIQNLITDPHHIYGPEKLEQYAQKWEREVSKSSTNRNGSSNEKTLADVKTYAEFRQLRANNPKIPERAWIYKQHYDGYQWEKLSNKYHDRETQGLDTPEKVAAWKKDLSKIGINRVKSKEEFDTWRIINKAEIPDEAWDQRAEYKRFKDAEFWERLQARYKPRKLPRRLSLEQIEVWKRDPRNKGLEFITTDEEFKVIIEDYNQDVTEDDDRLSLNKLKGYKTTAEEWENPELKFERQQEADRLAREKAASPTLTYGGMTIPPVSPKPYTPPPAEPFSHPSGETGKLRKKLKQIPIFGGLTIPQEEELEPIEDEDESVEAPILSERVIIPQTPIYDSQDEENEPQSNEPSRPSMRQLRRLGDLGKRLRMFGGPGAGAAGTGAAGAGVAGVTGAGTAGVTAVGSGAVITAPAWGTAAIAIIFILLFLAIVVAIISGGKKSSTTTPKIDITKTAPDVENGKVIPFLINISAPSGKNFVVTEELPPDTLFDSATENPELFDKDGNKLTQIDKIEVNNAIRKVKWTFRGTQDLDASQSGSFTKQISLNLKPTKNDMFVLNKATVVGEVISAGSSGSKTFDTKSQSLNQMFQESAQTYRLPIALLKAVAHLETGGVAMEYSEAEVQTFSKDKWWEGLTAEAGSLGGNDPLVIRGFGYNTCQYKPVCGPGNDVRGMMQFLEDTWNGVKKTLNFTDGHNPDRRINRDAILGAGSFIRAMTKSYPEFGFPDTDSGWTDTQVRAVGLYYCTGNPRGNGTDAACGTPGNGYDEVLSTLYKKYSGQ